MATPPVDLGKVFTYVDQHQEGFLARLIDYLRRPSISAYGEGIGEVAAYIADVMRQMGLKVQVLPTAGWPMVFGEYTAHSGAPTVLLYGHYDVQPPDPLEAWITPPFEPTVRDGRLYARGVGDNKGQHFAQLLALESLLACSGELACHVKVLLEGEEEVGSPHMPEFIREHRDELQADLVIISDGPVHESGRSIISFGVRGVLDIELSARGANQDLHSGNWGGIVPNPLWTLVHLLATMKNARGEITIEGFYDNVLPQSSLERAALEQLPIDLAQVKHALDLHRLDEPQERGYFERLSAWPTLTINGLHGGYGGPGSKTVLPHEAVAKCDIRLVEAQTVEEILGKVQAHVQRHAPEVSVISHGGMDPSKTPLDSPFTPVLHQAITAAQGEEPLLVPAMGGSLPNYAFTKTLGIPAFGVPYANADEANHAPNENMEVARFFTGIKTGAAMLSYLGALVKASPAEDS
ncbi:MAG TPA: M20/M25/M40 family metallo-hydrolase [Ktedonobacterales bacterium]|jgi:acetylornithine deacetylase/succinyl-diaminopimelate desuccinylase-like protein